ncbi:MAG: DUF2461 domain-containing protein [Oscillospiraceae bacterium]|nr:DUF2461 domain-containing protein [Oscillospiraceae bacterium]
MFEGFRPEAGAFFWELCFNNDREWFYAHRDQYDALIGTPIKELAGETYDLLITRFPDADMKLHIARIWRDARRLYGKGPLKDNLWFSIESAASAEGAASFFFDLRPATFSYGLGFWSPKTEQMEAFRRSVDANPAAFERLAASVERMKDFSLGGEFYKRPKGDYGDTVNAWYNRKWTNVIHEEDFGGDLLTPVLPARMADAFSALMPMYDYLTKHTGI